MASTAADEALKLEELAGHLPEERAQLLTDAAQEWWRADDARRAERLFEMAISDGGPVQGDARVHYARFLFECGETDRASEMLSALWTMHPADPRVYLDAGDLLVEQDDLNGANRWFTAGAARCLGGVLRDPEQLVDDPQLTGLLEARAQVRKFSGQSPDEWDRIWFEHYERTHPGKRIDQLWTREHMAEMRQENARLQDENTILGSIARGNTVLALAYWSRSEIDRAIAAFPQACADLSNRDDPHAVHRRTVESVLRAAHGSRDLVVVPLKVDDVRAHAERTGAEPDSVQTFKLIATLAGIRGTGIAWPVGRNDPCWCGSGRKYKKCCGAPGFAVDVSPGS